MSHDFPYHSLATAPDAARPLMQAIQDRFGMQPNITAVMASSPALLRAYLKLGDLLAASSLGSDEQQVVLLAASRANGCGYCVAAHSFIARMAGLADAHIHALRDDRSIDDARLEALRLFTDRLVTHRGWLNKAELATFLDAGFTPRNVLDVLVGVAHKTLSNYTNHMAGTRLDPAFAEWEWNGQARHADVKPRHGQPWDTERFGPVDGENDPQIAGLLEQARQVMGMLPNLARVTAGSAQLLEGLLNTREAYHATGLDPTEREVAAISGSRANHCDYCVAVHSAIMSGAGLVPEPLESLLDDRPLSDSRQEAVRGFSRKLVEQRGWLDQAERERFLMAGFEVSHILDLVLGTGLLVLSTYTNHLAGTEIDAAFLANQSQRSVA